MNVKDLLPRGAEVRIEARVSADIKLQVSRHAINDKAVRSAVASLLRNLGMDLNDENFKETPRRVCAMWEQWVKPKSLSLKVFTAMDQVMVTLVGHKTVSVCPHHLLPFDVEINIAYIPQEYVLGLSKLARIAEFASESFMLQENITVFVTSLIESLILPMGVACTVRASHGCMRLRGVKTTGNVVTSSLKGVFLTDEKARTEFYDAVRNGNHK